MPLADENQLRTLGPRKAPPTILRHPALMGRRSTPVLPDGPNPRPTPPASRTMRLAHAQQLRTLEQRSPPPRLLPRPTGETGPSPRTTMSPSPHKSHESHRLHIPPAVPTQPERGSATRSNAARPPAYDLASRNKPRVASWPAVATCRAEAERRRERSDDTAFARDVRIRVAPGPSPDHSSFAVFIRVYPCPSVVKKENWNKSYPAKSSQKTLSQRQSVATPAPCAGLGRGYDLFLILSFKWDQASASSNRNT